MADVSADQPHDREVPPASSSDGVPPLRVIAGLGDSAREQALVPYLSARGDLTITRCLTADDVVTSFRTAQADVALIAFDLHRLSQATLDELGRLHARLVLLDPQPDNPIWRSRSALLMRLDAEPESVRQALLAALRGDPLPYRPLRVEPETRRPTETAVASEPSSHLSTFAVASGPGSPGRTTVAINLAAALGAVAPTVLVDADLAGPSVAAYLDLDPTCNLAMIVHAEPRAPREWERAITQESQPLAPGIPHAVALCGVPKPELRPLLSPSFLERLVAELRQRYRYVILDVGSDLFTAEAASHRAALGLADQLLLVTSADLVGLWRARTTRTYLEGQLGINPDRLGAVVNRHDQRRNHAQAEIEWGLRSTLAALIPYDHAGVQRALVEQYPLVLDRRSSAGRALIDLAERIHQGTIAVPVEAQRGRSRMRLPQFQVPRVTLPRLRRGAPKEEVTTS